MTKKQHVLTEVADELQSEIDGYADLADELFGQTTPDQVAISRQENLARYQAHWQDPSWRVKELDRVGPERFTQEAEAAGVVPPGTWRAVRDG